MTIKALYPTVRPTLNLDFAKTKVLDPRVTFTRASTATFVGANGLIQSAASGVSRFDHNPATGESLGLLVEEARTNLLTYSEQFDNAAWSAITTTVSPNAITAPDGTLSADQINHASQSGGGWSIVFRTPGSAGTFSIFLRCNTGETVTNYRISYGGTITTATVTDQWQRFSVTTASVADIRIGSYSPEASPARTVYAWGAQVEAGAFPTSYIPTTSATVTRAADVASMTGTNFSSWYNQSAGSLFGSFVSLSNSNFPAIAAFSQTSAPTANRISLRIASSFCIANSVSQFSFSTSYTANQSTKVAWGFDSTATYYKNGTLVGTDSSVTLPTALDVMAIGTLEDSAGFPINGTIARLAYYPVRLTDTQLQTLTAS